MNKKIVFPIIAFLIILLSWEILVYFNIVNSLFLPAPLAILKSLLKEINYYLDSILVTFKHIIIGCFIGVCLAIPIVTFLPLFILWFGLNEIPIYLCSIIAAFFPTFLNTLHGIKKIDKSFIEVAQNFQIKAVSRRVVFPASLPYISNGLRQSIQLVFLVTPSAEMIMGDVGLGGFIWKSANLFRMELVILGMITLGVIGFLLFKIYEFIEQKYVLKWMNVRKDAED